MQERYTRTYGIAYDIPSQWQAELLKRFHTPVKHTVFGVIMTGFFSIWRSSRRKQTSCVF